MLTRMLPPIGGGRGGGGGGGPNQLGFHGDMQPSKRRENELFLPPEATGAPVGIDFDQYNDIPVEVSDGGIAVADALRAFDLEEDPAASILPESVRANIAKCGYRKPTPVQKYSIPIAGRGRDLMACAQTGSGKTGGFIFPMLTRMLPPIGGPPPPPPPSGGRGRDRAQH